MLRLIKGYFSHYSGLKFLAWQGIILNFAESIFVGIYYFLPIYFINELNFDVVTASLLISFYGIGTIAGGFLGGRLSDKYSSGKICISSLFLQTINFFLLIKFDNKNLLSINLFSMGLCSYAFITSSHLFVLEQCKNESIKLKALNILNVASNLGLALSAIIIGYLAEFGFKVIFLLSGISLLVLTLYCFVLIKKEERFVSIKITNDKVLEIANQNKTFTPIILLVLVCTFAMGFIIFQCSTTYSIYIQHAFPSLGLRSLSILFSLNSLLVVFLQTPISTSFGRFNKILVMGSGAFFLGFGMFSLTFSNAFVMAILSCVLYTFGEMLFFPVSQLICYEHGDFQKKGRTMGLYRTVYASSRVAAPILGGFVFEYLSGFILWTICGIIGAVSLIFCYLLKDIFTSNEDLIVVKLRPIERKYSFVTPKCNLW